MHSFLRLRYESVLSTAEASSSIVESMAHRHDFYERLESSASSPSLRASEPAPLVHEKMANGMDADAGNVKVVVRVRQFVPRGQSPSSEAKYGWC